MFEFKNFLQNNKMFLILLSAFSLLRLYIGVTMPIWLRTINAGNDDFLMFDYSHLSSHFSNWGIQSLVKDISYSLFLFFVRISKLSYRFWISILWIIAALMVIYAIYRFLTKNNKVLLVSFLFILFLPVAFDVDFGLRVYRNAIMPPCTIIFLTSLYIFINQLLNISNNKIKNIIFWGVISGLSFTFNYYIKEDGIITLPIFFICISLILVFVLYDKYGKSFTKQNISNIIKISILALLPIIIFAGCTFAYEEVNYHYFGVHEINTRTGAELGEFYGNLLKIDDSNKTTEIWIPASTVEKAYNVSPTFQSHQEFFDVWMHRTWGGGVLMNSSIRGDLPSWSIRYALNESHNFNDEQSVNELFYNINNELDEAFDNGYINKSDKIFISSSIPGKDINEIFALSPYIGYGLSAALFYEGFSYENLPFGGTSLNVSEDSKNIEKDLNDHLITENEYVNLSFLDKFTLDLIKINGLIYHFSSYIIVLLAFISFIMLCRHQVINKFKNRINNTLILFCLMLLGTMFVQIFSVAWYCSWLELPVLKFNLVSSYGTYATFAVFSIVGAYSMIEIKEPSESYIINNKFVKNKKTKHIESHNISELEDSLYVDNDLVDQCKENYNVIEDKSHTVVDSILENLIIDYNQQISVKVDHIDLTFEVHNEKVDTLKETFIRTLNGNKSKVIKIHALKDISFQIYKGEKIAIIGYNGAGKSTLLNVISGIYPPDRGVVETHGNISPLLALGAGFDYNYSGRKNILFNGAILGYDKEFLMSKIDEIIEFSELGDFIDIPIKNYSSGMLAKLAFSIATVVEPDILIIDEILGVGDVNFQKKSRDKIRSLMDGGTTVLFVSHSIPQVRELCDKAIWIDNGKLREIGEVNTVCDHYLKDAEKASAQQLANIQFK